MVHVKVLPNAQFDPSWKNVSLCVDVSFYVTYLKCYHDRQRDYHKCGKGLVFYVVKNRI